MNSNYLFRFYKIVQQKREKSFWLVFAEFERIFYNEKERETKFEIVFFKESLLDQNKMKNHKNMKPGFETKEKKKENKANLESFFLLSLSLSLKHQTVTMRQSLESIVKQKIHPKKGEKRRRKRLWIRKQSILKCSGVKSQKIRQKTRQSQKRISASPERIIKREEKIENKQVCYAWHTHTGKGNQHREISKKKGKIKKAENIQKRQIITRQKKKKKKKSMVTNAHWSYCGRGLKLWWIRFFGILFPPILFLFFSSLPLHLSLFCFLNFGTK